MTRSKALPRAIKRSSQGDNSVTLRSGFRILRFGFRVSHRRWTRPIRLIGPIGPIGPIRPIRPPPTLI
jgi:hypothetical protein